MEDIFSLKSYYGILVEMLNSLVIFPRTHISVYFYKWITYPTLAHIL